ncbi:uncharacterized protein LOC115695759 [Cannabis sativa]|uniref:uncharacterized protein LOC115695759 n=1 Tax=Cannabis sativa TaxID=3483 RepID=UPI0029C9E059|nr:uncharacterized protein LOC115695759 [Cannabis sativa]
MDSINFYNIKAEKANAILRYNQLKKLANLFRLVEIVVVLVLISRIWFHHVPVAVKNSGGYLREFSGILSSPRFVFVVGNVIVITLFVKSGKYSGEDSGRKRISPEYDLYDEFVKKSSDHQKIVHQNLLVSSTLPIKSSVPENNLFASVNTSVSKNNNNKNFERSNSEIVIRSPKKTNNSELKRSETENFGKKMKKNDDENGKLGLLYPEDKMSSEEFKLKVESFIARQQRFRMKEVYSGNDFL